MRTKRASTSVGLDTSFFDDWTPLCRVGLKKGSKLDRRGGHYRHGNFLKSLLDRWMFSTTTCCPQTSDNLLARTRASGSDAPPGGNCTTNARTGWDKLAPRPCARVPAARQRPRQLQEFATRKLHVASQKALEQRLSARRPRFEGFANPIG